MILKCLIDGTMTAFLNGKTKIDGKMPSHQYNHKININPQSESVLNYRRAGLSYTVASRAKLYILPTSREKRLAFRGNSSPNTPY